MQQIPNLVCGAFLATFVLFGCATNDTRANFNSGLDEALDIVAHPSSSFYKFDVAVKVLSYEESPSFWLNIAGDRRYTPEQRRRCVREFFIHAVTNGMKASDLFKAMDVPVNWISLEKVTAPRYPLAGWRPGIELAGRYEYYIPILDGKGGDYQLLIVMHFEQDIKLKDFVAALKGMDHGDLVGRQLISGCRPWDSNDQERKMPGSTLKGRAW
jgi:hypothetical protein